MKLIEAVENNDLELVKKLIKEGYPLNNKDTIYGYTSLMLASVNGNVEIVTILIKAGASLNEKDEDKYTSLMLASYEGHKEIVKELIKSGASLIETDKYGRTAMYLNVNLYRLFDIQDLILTMYPDKYSFLEENVGIHKDILLKLKMKQILNNNI